MTSALDPFVPTILGIVRTRTGADFSRYRAATVTRRISNRMISAGVASVEDYVALLEDSADEASRLLERLTIKVSRFYRNAALFDHLRREVIPELARIRAGADLRIWSAGCGHGEEAYTLAMLLEEAGVPGRVEASDVDPAALEIARIGAYPDESLIELPRELLARHLEPTRLGQREGHRVRPGIRVRVRFTHHDLTSETPGPGDGFFDLVACRNVLIYLDRETQEEVLVRLRRTVVEGGALCLGEAEWLLPCVSPSLAITAPRQRIFRAVGSPPGVSR